MPVISLSFRIQFISASATQPFLTLIFTRKKLTRSNLFLLRIWIAPLVFLFWCWLDHLRYFTLVGSSQCPWPDESIFLRAVPMFSSSPELISLPMFSEICMNEYSILMICPNILLTFTNRIILVWSWIFFKWRFKKIHYHWLVKQSFFQGKETWKLWDCYP